MFTFHKLAFSHLKKAVFHYMSNAKMTVLIDIKSQEIVANSEKDIESYLLNSLKEYHSESSAIVKTFDKTVEGSKRVFEGMLELCSLIKKHNEENNTLEIYGVKPIINYIYKIGNNDELFVELRGNIPRVVINYICQQIQQATGE